MLPHGVALEAGIASSESECRPRVLRVGIYGSDVVMNSPTADLACPVFEYFVQGPDSRRFEFFLFADGPSDVSHPSAKRIVQLFEGRLELFTPEMSSEAKYAKFVENELQALVTLTGWTHDIYSAMLAQLIHITW